jgi:hypothetical protein
MHPSCPATGSRYPSKGAIAAKFPRDGRFLFTLLPGYFVSVSPRAYDFEREVEDPRSTEGKSHGKILQP